MVIIAHRSLSYFPLVIRLLMVNIRHHVGQIVREVVDIVVILSEFKVPIILITLIQNISVSNLDYGASRGIEVRDYRSIVNRVNNERD